MYFDFGLAELSVNDPKVKIRFTLNGADPDENSQIYTNPILLQKTKQLKAISFRDNYRSQVQKVDFRLVKKLSQIELSYPPAEKYSGMGPRTLADLERATSDYKDKNWLGFQGDDLEASLTMEEIIPIQQISLSILNNPSSWIFPPTEVKVYAAVNPDYFQEVGSLNADQIDTRLKNGHRELMIKTNSIQAKYLKIVAKNIGVCPPGHSGEGQKAWLFVDEIILE